MIDIKVPPLGESIVEATISRWLKNPGDAVQQGEPLVELETDKVTVEVPAFKAGVLKSQARNEGDVVKVDETLGQLDETASGAGASPGEKAPAAAAARPAGSPSAESEDRQAEDAPRAAPAARRAAAEEGVSLAEVQGTARGGVITKQDVMAHAGGAPAAQGESATRSVQEEREASGTGGQKAAPPTAGGPPPLGNLRPPPRPALSLPPHP